MLSSELNVECRFSKQKRDLSNIPSSAKVFFAETGIFSNKLQDIERYLSEIEINRSRRFHHQKDKETYLISHAVTRVLLSRHLLKSPAKIPIVLNMHNKPLVKNSNLHFNISHTRNSFAIVISHDQPVGIDLEEINNRVNYKSLMNFVFSEAEQKFITHKKEDELENFFLLWTRKEALLKAIGIGIVTNLPEIEVSGENNYINHTMFKNTSFNNSPNSVHLYSEMVNQNYLSVATYNKSEIDFIYLSPSKSYQRLFQQVQF